MRRALQTLCTLALLAAPARAVEAPRLVVEAPPELAPVAREIERRAPHAFDEAMRLTGLADPGAPIVVFLAPEGSAEARSTPPWIAGYAQEAAGVVVLLPARVGRYPDRGLEPLLRHEVCHILVARAAHSRPVPRWFDEGLALTAGREADLGDRARVALAVLTADRLPLARLDRAFAGGESEVHAAYALAGDLVRELLRDHGADTGARILARVARGERFDEAFRAATGVALGEFEHDYWRRRTLWDRWVPVVSSSVVIWAGIAGIALAAFRRRRIRDAELRRRWEEEEAAGGGEEPPSDS